MITSVSNGKAGGEELEYLDHYWHVHKIGGSILGNAQNYSNVLQVVTSSMKDHLEYRKETDSNRVGALSCQAIIVSAMEGVTNQLLKMTQLAITSKDTEYAQVKDQILAKILECAARLIPSAIGEFERILREHLTRIMEVLRAISITQSMSEEMEDLIVGHGELWSAILLHLYLSKQGVSCAWLDTRKVLYVGKGECGPVVDWKRSSAEMDKWMKSNFNQTQSPCASSSAQTVPSDLYVLIVTGFIAQNAKGMPTTLGRNGSDYSASIFGALLKSSLITIWKDVDGLFSADPKIVPKATILKEVSYQEVSELSYFGANILHPHTMPPAIINNIPIKIRNFFNLLNKGSLIHSKSNDISESIYNVKGFSAIKRVSLINIEGAGLGISNLAQRVFLSLRDVKVSVLLISQGSSQSSICIGVTEKDGDVSLEAIKKEFYNETTYTGHVQTIELVKDCSIIAAVGDQMVSSIGVASKLFSALTKAGVNIKAIAQGSSERNISAVVCEKDTPAALKAVHSAFYRPFDPDVISIAVIGCGLIGSELLEQLSNPQPNANHTYKVRVISNSKQSIYNESGIELKNNNWKKQLIDSKEKLSIEKIMDLVSIGFPKHSVIIDCSASSDIPKYYPLFLSKGIHVITPNKTGFSGPFDLYKEIHLAASKHFSHCFYETTVGGGLPIIHMIKQMVSIGDKITKIEGIFSGTLSYIFNTFSNLESNQKWSDIVKLAKEKGFTEPDPRDDLNGKDFARKIVILAREIGATIELSDIKIIGLIPEIDKEASLAPLDEFMTKYITNYDESFEKMKQECREKDMVLRYSGVVQVEYSDVEGVVAYPKVTASVSLQRYNKSHAFANLTECDNIVSISSQRYNKTPLVIQGPGAGAVVTAAGVYGDLHRLSANLQHI
ncbi:hypothetical protein DFA_07277 [Cavenderia fasciculata]|uniref:ACT domain-containing protein n=1 Tax=Cavenderia fasciculata TaxID=261658 RepID=F4PVZ3_CACFS|nr:uncharacterized protein DFA_07277 [Cavenderia fasciculata]EGG20157.1 hypothetical protein DFA_07277 [Cavenderia fasciculata]|eukprot:XP_004367140.1 hypothetical protein DFA_07277 [Cavenderia fasciculata]